MTARTKSAAVKMLMELVRVAVGDEEGLVGGQKRFVAAAHGRLGGKGVKAVQAVEEPLVLEPANPAPVVEIRRSVLSDDPWAHPRATEAAFRVRH